MKSSTLLAALLPLCTRMATGSSIRQLNDPSDLSHFVFPQWSITNFDGGCSPGGCILDFNMSSAATPSGPAVAASCRVNGDRADWQACDGLGNTSSSSSSAVWAVSVPALDSFTVSVQHRYAVASPNVTRFYNVTANLTVDFETVRLPLNATVRPTRVAETWWWLRNVTSPMTGKTADMTGTTTMDVPAAVAAREGCGGKGGRACRSSRGVDSLAQKVRFVRREH